MRVLDIIGKVATGILAAVWLVGSTAVWLYLVARYGLFTTLFVIPIVISVLWLLFAVGVGLIGGLVAGIARGAGALVGLLRRDRRTEPEGDDEAERQDCTGPHD